MGGKDVRSKLRNLAAKIDAYEAHASGADLPLVTFIDSVDFPDDAAFDQAIAASDERIAALPPGSVRLLDLTGSEQPPVDADLLPATPLN